MSDPLLIYGATGYTGRLIAHSARDVGLRPILAGRNEQKLAPVADSLGLEYRVVRLSESERLVNTLRDVKAVIHTAGPFSQTARPMLEACLKTGTHYLDITGEIPVVELLAQRDRDARERGIMVMPGVGFDVVPSDCLAAHVARRLPIAERLVLALTGLRFATRGSAKTLMEHAFYGVNVRRNGVITEVPACALQRDFDFGDGPRPSFNVCWGDVATAYYTTGIPNIEVYFEITPTLRVLLTSTRYFGWALQSAMWQAWLKFHADLLPEGPTAAERDAVEMVIVAEAEDDRGRRVSARLRTPEAYSFTGVTAAAVAQRVLDGDYQAGFQTPGRVYGPDFVLSFAQVYREDLV